MSGSRAQTTLDFAIAMGIFLLAIAFVFTFIPSLTAPFVDGDQDRSAVADRTASHLSEGALGDPNRPLVVEEPCATAFFDDSDAPPECGSIGNHTDDQPRKRLGLSEDVGFYIRLVQVDASASGDDRYRTVCRTDDGTVVHEEDSRCDSDDVSYEIGEDPESASSVTVARRIVTVDDCDFEGAEACDATLLVEVY
ncbi:DUF7287 family protein [Natronomonas amylolytica]|uniref:DUF7287 family protein n=1 Tax=Natronomonas amylolytica TaxID=3108498 RepID=UPI00300A04B1